MDKPFKMDIQRGEGVNSPSIKLVNFQEILNKMWSARCVMQNTLKIED
tara:strand:- start:2451 stop:2594 length:144 start_codon:yes stop_codon:yes gene_type:complete